MQRTKFLWIVIPLLAITVVVSLSCGFGNHVDVVTTIRGVVTDSVTGEPIDSAIIQMRDTASANQHYTDSLGEYAYITFGYGQHRLFCRKEGYQSQSRIVTSSKGHAVVSGVNFQLSTQ